MREFLKQLQAAYDQIVENQIGRLTPGLTIDGFVDAYRKAVDVHNGLRRKTNDLLKNHLYPMLDDISSITDEDEAELFEAAQKLSSYKYRLDPGLALKIYLELLERARNWQDDAKILKYLYWCGITMFFLLYSRKDREQDLKTAVYFEEGSEYADRYDTFEDPETRQYIHRCLGNKSMMYYRLYGFEKAIEAEEEAFAFWNNLMFRGKDPDFPWLSYFIACLNHRHNDLLRRITSHIDTVSKAELHELLELSITINKLYNKNRGLYDAFGGSRYDFLLWRAQFMAGLISFDLLYENTLKRAAEFAEDDFSADAIFIKYQTDHYFIFFASNMPQLKDRKDEILPNMLEASISRLSSLPMSISPSVVSELLQSFAIDIGPLLAPSEYIDIILKLTAHRHIQTYTHSVMVSRLSVLLTDMLLQKKPEAFTGCLGISSAKEAVSRAEELRDFAKTVGLCHDIGVISFAANPFMNSRVLTDEEYDIVKQHPKDGAELLKLSGDSILNKGYIDVVLGHHKHYDNIGGYPEDFDASASEVRIMIDIVSIANKLDTSTDNIVKPYSEASSVKEACRNVCSRAGSRYSPVVAELLHDNAVVAEIEHILDTERREAYYAAYLHAWES